MADTYTLPPAWDTALHDWSAWQRLSGKSDGTVKLRRSHLRTFAHRSSTTSPAEVTLDALLAFLGAKNWSIEHRRSVRAALADFFKWAKFRGIVSENVAALLPRIRAPHANPRPATEQQFDDLIASAAPRERLMGRLAGELGLRRGEVAKCHLRDLVRDQHGWTLFVVGKGDKQRAVPVTDDLADEILDFCKGGYLFPNGTGGHLTANYVGTLMSRRLEGKTTMHQLRHRFASVAYQRTLDIRALQTVLGHSSLGTTQRYVQVAEMADRRLVESVAGKQTDEGVVRRRLSLVR